MQHKIPDDLSVADRARWLSVMSLRDDLMESFKHSDYGVSYSTYTCDDLVIKLQGMWRDLCSIDNHSNDIVIPHSPYLRALFGDFAMLVCEAMKVYGDARLEDLQQLTRYIAGIDQGPLAEEEYDG